MKSTVIVLGLALASLSFTPSALAGGSGGDYSVTFGVGPAPARVIPSLGHFGLAALIILLVVAALPFLPRNV